MRFNSDGTYEVAEDKVGLDSALVDQGRFEVNGDTSTFISSASGDYCGEGATGSYRIGVIDADHLGVEMIDDECAARRDNPPQTYERRF